MEEEKFTEKGYYRQKIIEMVKKIENIQYLIKIFSFIKAFLEE